MGVKASARVWEHSRHSGSHLLMLLAIADFADDNGNAYPSVSTLATKCRMKERNARYVLKDLQDSHELEVREGEGPRGTNRYQIVFANLGLHHSAGVQAGAGLHHSAHGAALECTKPLHRSAAEPSLNHQEPSCAPLSASKPTRPACPQVAIRDLYAEVLPDLPAIKRWGNTRQAACRARWNETAQDKGWSTAAEGLAWFRRFFETVAASDFLMGRVQARSGHENWRCDIDHLLSSKGFTGVVEGKYGGAPDNRAPAHLQEAA